LGNKIYYPNKRSGSAGSGTSDPGPGISGSGIGFCAQSDLQVGPRAPHTSTMASFRYFNNCNGKSPNTRIVMANLKNLKIVMASILLTLEYIPIGE
jgi:hypothetical protein